MLEDDLVDDAATGTPEADAVFCRDALQEVVDLLVHVDRDVHVGARTDLGEDQVVAVHGGGHRGRRQTCGHELEQCHLCGGVLHRDAIGGEVGIAATALHVLVGGIGEVVDEDLFGQRERATEATPPEGDGIGEACIDAGDEFDRGSCADGHWGLLYIWACVVRDCIQV